MSGRWSRFTLHRGKKGEAKQSIGSNGDKVMKRDAFGEVRLDSLSLWVVGTESGLPRSRSASASHAPLLAAESDGDSYPDATLKM